MRNETQPRLLLLAVVMTSAFCAFAGYQAGFMVGQTSHTRSDNGRDLIRWLYSPSQERVDPYPWVNPR